MGSRWLGHVGITGITHPRLGWRPSASTINPKKGLWLVPFTSPQHHSAKEPTPKPSRALLFIYLTFFGNILIVIECSTSYSKYRTVTNSWLKSVREITTWSSEPKPEQKTNGKITPNLHFRWTNCGCGALQGISPRPCSLHTCEMQTWKTWLLLGSNFFCCCSFREFFFFGICFYLRALIILKNYLVWWWKLI